MWLQAIYNPHNLIVVDENVDEIMNHLFILNFHNLERKKNKRCERYKGFLFGKKMGAKSPHYEEKKNLNSCLTLYIKKVSTCAHMDVGGQDDGTQSYL
jgi:hypothetical protein